MSSTAAPFPAAGVPSPAISVVRFVTDPRTPCPGPSTGKNDPTTPPKYAELSAYPVKLANTVQVTGSSVYPISEKTRGSPSSSKCRVTDAPLAAEHAAAIPASAWSPLRFISGFLRAICAASAPSTPPARAGRRSRAPG
jgi:hypothetical protein